MAQRPSATVALGCIVTASALWLVIGVPVAAVIVAYCMSLWVMASLLDMAVTAVVLGAVQGLWLCLAGRRCESDYNGFLRLGLSSGALLGVLAFPPVFSRAGIIAARPTAAFLLMAAVAGGVAAGLIAAHVLYLPLQAHISTMGQRAIVGGLILVVLAAIDYRYCWAATAERIAVPEVSRQEITDLSAGSARGSRWAGCYEYQGKTPLDQGGESGLLKVTQTDGSLKVAQGRDILFLGGVDGNGHFRFGAETTAGPDALRTLWQGKFRGDSFEFNRRMTVVNGVNGLGINPLIGKGQLVPCDQ
jgi:hypothetical protein